MHQILYWNLMNFTNPKTILFSSTERVLKRGWLVELQESSIMNPVVINCQTVGRLLSDFGLTLPFSFWVSKGYLVPVMLGSPKSKSFHPIHHHSPNLPSLVHVKIKRHVFVKKRGHFFMFLPVAHHTLILHLHLTNPTHPSQHPQVAPVTPILCSFWSTTPWPYVESGWRVEVSNLN